MDETDREILDILKKDGRASYTKVAEKLDVSEGTVRNRVEQMESEGLIEKFTVEVSDDSAVGALVMVELSTDKPIEEILERMPEDLEILEITGDYDLAIQLDRRGTGKLNDALDRIRGVEGVEDTKTYSVLRKSSR